MTRYLIRNMVCPRCEQAVRTVAEATEQTIVEVGLGHVDFGEALSPAELLSFETQLRGLGFERIRERAEVLTEEVELVLRKLVQEQPGLTVNALREQVEPRLSVGYEEAAAVFKRQTDLTPGDRYNYLRMVRACELLREGELQVSEVGYLLGYNHLSGFSRAFKREVGVSPREFAGGAMARLRYV